MRHRFVDRRNKGRVIWLELQSNGYFKYRGKDYSQTVLQMMGIHHSPETERVDNQPVLKFVKPAEYKGLKDNLVYQRGKRSRKK